MRSFIDGAELAAMVALFPPVREPCGTCNGAGEFLVAGDTVQLKDMVVEVCPACEGTKYSLRVLEAREEHHYLMSLIVELTDARRTREQRPDSSGSESGGVSSSSGTVHDDAVRVDPRSGGVLQREDGDASRGAASPDPRRGSARRDSLQLPRQQSPGGTVGSGDTDPHQIETD